MSCWPSHVSTTSASSPLPRSRERSRFFMSTPATNLASSSAISSPSRSASRIRLMCFEIAPFFAPVAFACCLKSGSRPLRIVSDRSVADELADLLRVLGRDLPDEVGEHLAGELARLLERWHCLLLGPVR